MTGMRVAEVEFAHGPAVLALIVGSWKKGLEREGREGVLERDGLKNADQHSYMGLVGDISITLAGCSE